MTLRLSGYSRVLLTFDANQRRHGADDGRGRAYLVGRLVNGEEVAMEALMEEGIEVEVLEAGEP